MAMDSTPIPSQPLNPSATKLPLKRKSPDPNFLNPTIDSSAAAAAVTPPPFKFHRIWTEADEIQFLQGLLDSGSDGLFFPRDLHVFFAQFSGSMSQPYTKSQLSEKLRRLRKKFRVVSSRIARGLDASLLSTHDRALFEISKNLWSDEYSSESSFGKLIDSSSISSKKNGDGDLVGVRVRFSPYLPFESVQNQTPNQCLFMDDHEDDNDLDVKMSEVHVDYDYGCLDGIGGTMAKTILNVFDQSLKEVRMVLISDGSNSDCPKEGKAKDFDKLWREQRVAELNVLASRLRLVLENSLARQ